MDVNPTSLPAVLAKRRDSEFRKIVRGEVRVTLQGVRLTTGDDGFARFELRRPPDGVG